MSDQIKPEAGTESGNNAASAASEQTQSTFRRNLLRGALAAPVLMAVASKPVLAGQLCAPSGFASGNTSSVDNPSACNGLTPGYWKAKPGVQWPAPYSPTLKFHSVFAGSYFGNKTLFEVLSTGGGGLQMLARHCIASILNASISLEGYVMTVDEIKAIWAQCLATAPNSIYTTGTGITMNLSDLDEFFTATYHQNMLAYYD